jgi:hypothetical protein
MGFDEVFVFALVVAAVLCLLVAIALFANIQQ